MDPVDIGRALVMILFSGINIALSWVNYLDLSSPDNQYGLVVGPPTRTTLMALFVLCVVASVMCGIEILNALSLPFNEGRPRLPLELEQCLALAGGSVPLAAVNLSVVVCRMRHHTPLQISSCVFLVLNFLIRMVYARAFAQEYKSCGRSFKLFTQVICGLLFVLLLVLAGLVWGRVNASFRPVPSGPGSEWLRGVSILLLRAPALEGRTVEGYDLTSLVRRHNMHMNMPWLVKDLLKLTEEKDGSVTYRYPTYPCNALRTPESELLIPTECAEGYDQLKFHFKYNHGWEWRHNRPMGIVSYNYALVSSDNKLPCNEANQTLSDGWKLFYLRVKLQPRNDWTVDVLADTPWTDACTVPYPLYDPSIHVCSPS